MLQDIYDDAYKQITTAKFFALPPNHQENLLLKLQELILLSIRSIILENASVEEKDRIEGIVRRGSDDDLFQFGCQSIPDFDAKLTLQVTKLLTIFSQKIYAS